MLQLIFYKEPQKSYLSGILARPELDGIFNAFNVEVIYHREKQPNVFEILITAYANGEICREAKMLGVRDIIPKPFTSEDVETFLSRIIGKSA